MSVMEIYNDSSQDSDSVWGPRTPVTIDSESGLMSAGFASRPLDVRGDVDLALSSYLSMVYELRSMATGVIPLREEDLLVLANAFEMEETDLAERLARIMHCDDLQTHRFIQMVKKGRVLVPVSMVAAGALLAASITFSSPAPSQSSVKSQTKAPVEVVVTTTPVQVSVDIGEATQVERATVTDEVAPSVISEDEQQVTTPNPADVGPGEIEIGDSATISRDDGIQR